MKYKHGTRVGIYNVLSELNGKTGYLAGIANTGLITVYIVNLDDTLTVKGDTFSSIVIPESCLFELIPTKMLKDTLRELQDSEIDDCIRLARKENQECDNIQVIQFLTHLDRFKNFKQAESSLLYLNGACKWSVSTKKACEAGIHLAQFAFSGKLRKITEKE